MKRSLLALLILTGIVLTFCQSDAQTTPTWRNDAQGRPAPPCMVLDETTGRSVACTSTNPLPTGSTVAGQGTTTGTSQTGFGRQWFPSNITGSTGLGEPMIGIFIDDTTVAIFRRSTTCGNCLQVAQSNDGGVSNTPFVSTGTTLGNTIRSAFRVPSSPPRYLVSNIDNNPTTTILQSSNLVSGYVAVTGISPVQESITSFASNADGSVVLANTNVTGAICRSTNNGVSFGSCTAGIAVGGLTYVSGNTFLLTNSITVLRRSTDNGASWSIVNTFPTNISSVVCSPDSAGVCVAALTNGTIQRSSDSGTTWTQVDSGFPNPSNIQACYMGSNTFAALDTRNLPIGLSVIGSGAHSGFNNGQSWFAGQINGTPWDGTGTAGGPITCRNGRGYAAINVSGGSAQLFGLYNPLTSPGNVLTSSAGGYNISAPIQSGIILNATQTSAATTAQTITLTNTSGSRICIRNLSLFTSNAAQNVTLVIQNNAVTTFNLGTVTTTAVAGNPITFFGTPLFCSQTSNNLQVVVGAAGAGTTTLSVVADRYPN